MAGLSRRTLLTAGAMLGAGGVFAAAGPLGGRLAHAVPAAPAIHPRGDWAQSLPGPGSLPIEAAGDVRFLIVHHSESPNTERPGTIPARLRSFHRYHTTTKQWPDVAYNFFVDPFGEIWEGRAGSLGRPVRGDATGGSQGFAQLCCFVGDHSTTPPTPAAMQAMTVLLAWLAGQYGIDLAAGKAIRFTSRGSNRWQEGVEVVTDPIVGHRDMSQTSCPGDALYPLVRTELLPGALELTVGAAQGTPQATPTAPTPTEPTPTELSPTAPTPTEPGATDRLGELAVPLGAATAVLGGALVSLGVVHGRKRA